MTAMATRQPAVLSDGPFSVAPAYRTVSVLAAAAGGVMVDLHGTPSFARVALSCLIAPEPGDLVLAAAAGELWVVALCERKAATPLRFTAPGDLVIAATGALTLTGDEITAKARKASFILDEVTHIGRTLTAHLPTIRTIGGVIETVAERVLLQAKRSLRLIEESDHLKAGIITHEAEQSLHLQAENAFVTAGNAIRLDANQIHMG